MNKIIKKIMSLTLTVIFIAVFAGCDNSESSSKNETTVVPTTIEPTTIDPSTDITIDLKTLHYYDSVNGDDIAGAWKISDGEGSQYESFVFVFDGSGKVVLFIDNVGYLENYTLDESNKNLTAQLMFGINGTYSYKISDDKKSLEITNTKSNAVSTLTKLDDFTMLPKAEEKPQLDDKIFGAWLSENGEYMYFEANGIMYNNLYGMTLTYSNYNAVDGVITSKYTILDEELTDTYEYSVNDNVLTLNSLIYNRIPASELV